MNILIVALDDVTPADVDDADVLVVAPARTSWLRRWLSDEDGARRTAQGRAAELVERLEKTRSARGGPRGRLRPDARDRRRAPDLRSRCDRDRRAGRAFGLVRRRARLRAHDRFGLPTSTRESTLSGRCPRPREIQPAQDHHEHHGSTDRIARRAPCAARGVGGGRDRRRGRRRGNAGRAGAASLPRPSWAGALQPRENSRLRSSSTASCASRGAAGRADRGASAGGPARLPAGGRRRRRLGRSS